jgi:hypothetical protein
MKLVISAADAQPGGLPEALREAERLIAERRPEIVVLADDSDFALAAALVALKALVPVEVEPGAIEGSGTNARLIAQLAPSYTAPG